VPSAEAEMNASRVRGAKRVFIKQTHAAPGKITLEMFVQFSAMWNRHVERDSPFSVGTRGGNAK
jgi:hypothetical protein